MGRFDDVIWGTSQKVNDYYIPSEHVELLSSASQANDNHRSHDFNRKQAAKAMQSGDTHVGLLAAYCYNV